MNGRRSQISATDSHRSSLQRMHCCVLQGVPASYVLLQSQHHSEPLSTTALLLPSRRTRAIVCEMSITVGLQTISIRLAAPLIRGNGSPQLCCTSWIYFCVCVGCYRHSSQTSSSPPSSALLVAVFFPVPLHSNRGMWFMSGDLPEWFDPSWLLRFVSPRSSCAFRRSQMCR